MTLTRGQIDALVMRIQDDFLDAPALTLSARQAARRVQTDVGISQAILDALIDSQVLTRTADGRYARCFPRPVPTVTSRSAHAA